MIQPQTTVFLLILTLCVTHIESSLIRDHLQEFGKEPGMSRIICVYFPKIGERKPIELSIVAVLCGLWALVT